MIGVMELLIALNMTIVFYKSFKNLVLLRKKYINSRLLKKLKQLLPDRFNKVRINNIPPKPMKKIADQVAFRLTLTPCLASSDISSPPPSPKFPY